MQPAPAEKGPRVSVEISSWVAAAWATLFALVHVYWALGGAWGLPRDVQLLDNGRLFAATLVAIPACAAAAVLARAVVSPLHASKYRTHLVVLVAAAATFFAVHSSGSMLQLISGNIHAECLTERERFVAFLYEPWWFAGALVFASLALTASTSMTAKRASDNDARPLG
jgi:hypothetical protein